MKGVFMSENYFYKVGNHYAEFCTRQDFFRIEYDNNGFVMIASMCGITDSEKLDFETDSKFEIRFTVLAGVCFFSFRFGSMPWSDCPFHPAIYRDKRCFPTFADDEGFSLPVLLFDSATGELVYFRLIGLGHEFSIALSEWATTANEEDMSREKYNHVINEVYKSYSSAEIASMADVKYELNP